MRRARMTVMIIAPSNMILKLNFFIFVMLLSSLKVEVSVISPVGCKVAVVRIVY